MLEVEMPAAAGAIKTEPSECPCAVCGDAAPAGTLAGAVAALLWRHAPLLPPAPEPRACAPCGLLLAALERAEAEYARSKAAFEAVLARNPLCAALVKQEPGPEPVPSPPPADSPNDSEDEPLALTKQKRHRSHTKRKKKVASNKKTRKSIKKNDSDTRWNLPSQIVQQLAPVLSTLKKEDSLDGSECSISGAVDIELKLEPDEASEAPERPKPARGRGRPRSARTPVVKLKELHQCEQCPAKYTSLKRLEQHRDKHAKGPYICEVCGAAYKHKRACDVHVALHRGISDWKCSECDRLFPSRGALQRHNAIHTGTPAYQCEQCGKSFIHTSSFKMHKLAHSGLKAHACGVCGLKLMTRSHLKRHARVHSGEKRHECGLCGKRFSERYNLVAHGRAHAATGEGAGPAPPAAPRRRLFRCPYCPDRFERRYMLERHTASAHGRTLERGPPTPRNTMSKLLKAQALGLTSQPSQPPGLTSQPVELTSQSPPASLPRPLQEGALKEERSPEGRAPPHHKYSSSPPPVGGSWSGAFQEFGLRAFPP